MLKKLKAILIVTAMLLTIISVPSFAEEEFKANATVDFDAAEINYSVTTPARYRQVISVRVYFGDPAVLVRTDEIVADTNGKASGKVIMDTSLDNADETGYYTIKFQGGGYLSDASKDEVTVFYEKHSELYDITLPAFNSATEDELGALFAEKEDMLIFSFDDYYDLNSDLIHKIFVTSRTEDFNSEFTTFTQVQDAMDYITLITDIRKASSPESVREICEKEKSLLGIDTEDSYYKGSETQIYTVLRSLFKEKCPYSLKELKLYIRQATALANLNKSNSEQITGVITDFYTELGIDISDYNSLCALYGAKEFNKPFVEAGYMTVTAFKSAYNTRKNTISEGGSGSGGGTGGGGGGGFSGGSSNKDVNAPITNIETSGTVEEKPEKVTGFSDVTKSHWAYQSVIALNELGVVAGFPDGSFLPDENVTREQFIKMLVEAFNLYDENAQCNFSDVDSSSWYHRYVASAYSAGITKGQGDVFGTGSSITRQDAAVMIQRILVPEMPADYAVKSAFKDDGDISSYARNSVYKLVDMKIINGVGDNSFAPKANLTRAQAAKIIYGSLSYSYQN